MNSALDVFTSAGSFIKPPRAVWHICRLVGSVGSIPRPFRKLPQRHATNGHILDMVLAWIWCWLETLSLGGPLILVSLPETYLEKNALKKIGLFGPKRENSFKHQASIFRGAKKMLPLSTSFGHYGASKIPSDMVRELEVFFFVFFFPVQNDDGLGLCKPWGSCWVLPTRLIEFTELRRVLLEGVVRGDAMKCSSPRKSQK